MNVIKYLVLLKVLKNNMIHHMIYGKWVLFGYFI